MIKIGVFFSRNILNKFFIALDPGVSKKFENKQDSGPLVPDPDNSKRFESKPDPILKTEVSPFFFLIFGDKNCSFLSRNILDYFFYCVVHIFRKVRHILDPDPILKTEISPFIFFFASV